MIHRSYLLFEMDWHHIILVFLVILLTQCSNHTVRCFLRDVRLVGGPTSKKGTVELRQGDGAWETTCGQTLETGDVSVICRQLGFTGANIAIRDTPYGHNSTPTSELDCNGDENELAGCRWSLTTGCTSTAGAASCHGEGFLGCFWDAFDYNLALPGDRVYDYPYMTISTCIQFCNLSNKANFTYAGVKYGNQCFCGEASDNYARHGVGSAANCQTPCSGDPTDSCGGSAYIAVFTIQVETVETPVVASTEKVTEVTSQPSSEMTSNTIDAVTSSSMTTPLSTHSTLQQSDNGSFHVETSERTPAVMSTENVNVATSQPSSANTSNTMDDVTSSAMTTPLSMQSTLPLSGHGSCVGVAAGEGVVIILLIATIIVMYMYILRIRKKQDSNPGQTTHDMTLVQASSSHDGDTGIYHDIQDIRTPVPSSTPAGDAQYSSEIYDQTHGHTVDPSDTGIPTESTQCSTRIEKDGLATDTMAMNEKETGKDADSYVEII